MFPLAVCQHISPSLVPAGDHEWTFVVNFETVAIRFSCNSRETMEEWVDCIRNKLGEMGILNPKGNLYSRVPSSVNPSKTRNPMSPLPQPPSAENRPQQQSQPSQLINNSNNNQSTTNENNNQSFTTSIYLNQSSSNQGSSTTNNQPTETSVTVAQTSVTVTPQSSAASVSTVSTTTSSGATSSVYLNKSNPTRHVTRIPINKENGEEEKEDENETTKEQEDEEPYYDAIPDMPASEPKPRIPSVLKKRQQSPSKQPGPPPSSTQTEKEELARRSSDKAQPQRIKKKSQRSSSLGPLLDEQSPIGSSMANTNSLESIDSNPRQKLPKGELLRERPHGRIRATGAIPRRPLALSNSQEATTTPSNPNIGMDSHVLSGSMLELVFFSKSTAVLF